MMFTYCPNFDVSSFSVTGDIDFETGHFASFEQFKIDLYFANSGQVKIDPVRSFLLTLDRSQLFSCIWTRHNVKNSPKIQEPRIGSGTSYFQ